MKGLCPDFPAAIECFRCAGKENFLPPDLDRSDFAECAGCGGSSATYMPLEPGKFPTPQYPRGSAPVGGTSSPNDPGIYIGLAVLAAAVIAVIAFVVAKKN